MKHFKNEWVTETITPTTLKEGTPTRVILSYLAISNPGETRNQRIRLPEMANIGIGAPSTILKEIFYGM